MKNKLNFKEKYIKNSLRIISQIYKHKKLYLLLSILQAMVEGISPSIFLLILQNILNGIQISEDLYIISKNILLIAILGIFKTVLLNFISYRKSKLSKSLSLELDNKILTKITRLSLNDFEDSKTYDLISRAKEESGEKLVSYFEIILKVVTNLLSLSTYIIILLKFEIWLILILFVIPFINYIYLNRVNLIKYDIHKNRTNDARKSRYLTFIITYGTYFKEIKLFNLSNKFLDMYLQYNKRFNDEDLRLEKKQKLYETCFYIIDSILNTFIIFYLVYEAINDLLLVGDVITYIRVMNSIKNSINELLFNLSSIINNNLFVNNLIEFTNLDIVNEEFGCNISRIESIEIKNLSYTYPSSNSYALDNINLNINCNEKIALIGKNGSGKTTLIKIIMGFYDDYEGEVRINGIDLRKINKNSLQNRISAIFQDYCKYEGTLRENIAFGDIDLLNEDEIIRKSMKEFDFDDKLSEFPKGIDTQLGFWFDNGVGLSAGQWQKLALSRSFLKKADLYILDEPNAAIDVISEQKLYKKLESLLEGKLSIIISHDIENVTKIVDKIVVIDKGKIIEVGSRESLLENNKVYKSMIKK